MPRVFAWKALTYRTLLELSGGTQNNFYYALGLTPVVAPQVRGSCLTQFSYEFVKSSISEVNWWAIPDTGAISAGFIGDRESDHASSRWQNDRDSLDFFLDVLNGDEGLCSSVLNHVPIVGSKAEALEIAGIAVPRPDMLDARWWLYEIQLNGFAGGLRNEHIVALHIPRTMRREVNRLLDVDSQKVKYFNPHFGFESMKF
jgi:hypothetical protein